jgi:mutator protein MutT
MKHYNVSAAIIYFEGQILCVQRGQSKFDYISNKYEFPGGKIEVGETNEDALIREIREELNLNIEKLHFFDSVEYSYPDFSITMHAYKCIVSDFKKIILNEHQNYVLLNVNELLKLDWASADIPLVNKLIEEFNDNLIEGFVENLKEGYIESSTNVSGQFMPRLLTNEKKEGIKVLSSIITELNLCNEFWFSVAFLTNSGLQSIINSLDDLKNRNIKGKILVSKYLNFTEPAALRRLLKFENIELRINKSDNFHSKGYLFYRGIDRGDFYNLIVGSSNLTANALSTNKELNLKVSGKKSSYIISKATIEFSKDFLSSDIVDQNFIDQYELEYERHKNFKAQYVSNQLISDNGKSVIFYPNKMQKEALENLKNLREDGKNKALIISATGTGKTFLSAFDAREFNPNRLLFIVHRANIAEASLKTFKLVFGDEKEMGMFSGNIRNENCDFIFSTIQTLSRDSHLSKFAPNDFDYIIIDESHRAGAESYKKIVNYFNPDFLLGMTATPERTDGFDIFSLYDHNIAYEIRLQQALEIEILSPFHYFGVSDLTINGAEIEDKSEFNLLTADERIDRILESSNHYNCDDGNIRALVFCSKVEEAFELSRKFNDRGYRSIALSGDSSEDERSFAIDALESNDINTKIDYIFTRDIFNEGIDIPRVNQVIMLRPTQSAIVFVQQLGRGLRKAEGKEYLTVIDFIGNYSNNFLIPIALFGDKTFNKDNLRKLISNGSNQIPGTSTINFDYISKQKIYSAIDQTNFALLKELKNDYKLLKFKIGYTPMMMDFLYQGNRDPYLYVINSGSYFNFLQKIEPSFKNILNEDQIELLVHFSNEVNNAKRVEEAELLNILLNLGSTTIDSFKHLILEKYEYLPSEETIKSLFLNINFYFTDKRKFVKGLISNEIVESQNGEILFSKYFKQQLENSTFKKFFQDNVYYSIARYDQTYDILKYKSGFLRYNKYSRKDVCRILNWDDNEESTVYGYRIKYNTCPIFVNYHKEDNIASSTKFGDKFINNIIFEWYSKSRRTLKSKDVKEIKSKIDTLRFSFFVKKYNGEGNDFYYLGEVKPLENSFLETSLKDDNGKDVSVVKILLKLDAPVEDSLYNYLTNEDNNE